MNLWCLVLLVPVAFATVCDLRTREIPDWIALGDYRVGLSGYGLGLDEVRWTGLMAGAAARTGALRLPCSILAGSAAVTLSSIAAIGAAVGPSALLCDSLLDGLGGRRVGPDAAARGKRDFAYVPAIAVGVLMETVWPGGLRTCVAPIRDSPNDSPRTALSHEVATAAARRWSSSPSCRWWSTCCWPRS